MMTRRTTRRGSQRRGLATFLLVILGVFGLTFVGSVMGTAGGMFAAYTYFASDLPDPDILTGIEPAESTYVYDRSGEHLLARFECQNREAVTFGDLPDHIWQATVASEDRTFWENNGVDFQAIVRAALVNLEAGEIRQGASTITQQVIDYARVLKEEGISTQPDADATPAPSVAVPIRTRRPPRARRPRRRRMSASRRRRRTRPRSRTRSARTSWPCRSPGPTRGAPARRRSSRPTSTSSTTATGRTGSGQRRRTTSQQPDLSKLTVSQAAFLAALPQAPSFLDPYQNPNFNPDDPEAGAADALRERDLVLGAMLEEGYITRAQYNEARATTFAADESRPDRQRAPGAALQLPRAPGGGAHPRLARGRR